jgi:hypothetical protein
MRKSTGPKSAPCCHEEFTLFEEQTLRTLREINPNEPWGVIRKWYNEGVGVEHHRTLEVLIGKWRAMNSEDGKGSRTRDTNCEDGATTDTEPENCNTAVYRGPLTAAPRASSDRCSMCILRVQQPLERGQHCDYEVRPGADDGRLAKDDQCQAPGDFARPLIRSSHSIRRGG